MGPSTLWAREVFLQRVMLKLRFACSEGAGVRRRLFQATERTHAKFQTEVSRT